MIYIEDIAADEVLDSRGNPTVRAKVTLSDGTVASAIVPVTDGIASLLHRTTEADGT